MEAIRNGGFAEHNNGAHFMPIRMLGRDAGIFKSASAAPIVLSDLMYSSYQRGRVNSLLSGELARGIDKFAEEIYCANGEFEKVAGFGPKKAILVGIPIAYGYSGYQRARINNGNRVSTANRFIAENPGTTALLQMALTPKVVASAAKALKSSKLKSAAKKVTSVDGIDTILESKIAGYYNNDIEKVATYNDTESLIYQGDMFKDEKIASAMLQKYSHEQFDTIKIATILIGMGEQSRSNDLLTKAALTEDDIEQYLKTAEESIRIEFEKNASFVDNAKNLASNVASDVVFNRKGNSSLAMLPGNVIDGLIFTKLFSMGNKPEDKKKQQVAKTLVTNAPQRV